MSGKLKRATMKDQYPSKTTIPGHSLADAIAQPDYADVDLPRPNDSWNIADRLADAHVRAGRGELVAALHAESGKAYTFSQLAKESAQLAAGLIRHGIQTGDRVAYRTTNDPDALIVMLAIWKAGAVVVPVPAQAKANEIRHYIDDTGARILFVHHRAGPLDEITTAIEGSGVEELIGFGDGHDAWPIRSWNDLKVTGGTADLRTDPDQVAIIWHTGGTTGKPKGCYHTHKRFLLGGYALGAGTGSAVGQRWAAAAPVGHALGIIHYTIFTLLHGATVVFIENFSDPRVVLRAIADHKITTLTGLMATWAKMAEVLRASAPVDISSLKRCFAMWQSASAADVYDFWLSRGIELLNNFGSTSFATWVLVPPLGETSPRGALGRALPGYRVEAVEVKDGVVQLLPRGEIGRMAVRGPTGLTYWNLPDMQRRDVIDGWTLSDDLIQFDQRGIVHYLGRTDYMISSAGYKIAPVEVEQVLSRHPAVREVAVVPGPCPIRQEIVVAYIALHPTAIPSDALKGELTELVKSEIASYKAPRRIEFIESLPRDSVGKVRTKLIKEWANTTVSP